MVFCQAWPFARYQPAVLVFLEVAVAVRVEHQSPELVRHCEASGFVAGARVTVVEPSVLVRLGYLDCSTAEVGLVVELSAGLAAVPVAEHAAFGLHAAAVVPDVPDASAAVESVSGVAEKQPP
ncbi:MAG: hypothetical protein JWP29_5493 [Rhodoferax sp.]|nr:hypothetical protein [Rhodoferax sp.]